MYKAGMTKECPKCVPNCMDTNYKTGINWSPIEESLAKEYNYKYNWHEE